MEDTPKLLRIRKSECPDMWIRIPRHRMAKNHGQTCQVYDTEGERILIPDKKRCTVEHTMAARDHMHRITAWDGLAEKWTEYENEVLWSEQNLKPSERPQLVARLV